MKSNQNTHRPRIAKNCICCGSDKLLKSPAVLMPFVAHRVFDWAPVEIDETWGLETIKPGFAHSICNTLECSFCGCLFLDIRFDDLELEMLYKNYRDEEYVELRESYEPGYRARNRELLTGVTHIPDIENFLSPYLKESDSILDWGGDTGKNTPFKSSSKRHIYDINPRTMLEDAIFVEKRRAQKEHYDVVICSQVLEHTPFPSEVLIDIIKCLRENTILYIEVPKEKIFSKYYKERYKFKRYWHEHINFYTEKALRELCNFCGLNILEIKTLKLSPSDKAQIFQIACKLSNPSLTRSYQT